VEKEGGKRGRGSKSNPQKVMDAELEFVRKLPKRFQFNLAQSKWKKEISFSSCFCRSLREFLAVARGWSDTEIESRHNQEL
jgi:hypothetical protein